MTTLTVNPAHADYSARFGRAPDPPDPRDHPIRRYLAARPTPNRHSVMHRLGPVVDQGSEPECVAFSGGTAKTFHERKDHRRTYLFDRRGYYRLLKTRDGIPHVPGTYIRVALDTLLDIGIARQGKPWDQDASKFRIAAYARLRTIAEIEETLRYIGPVWIGSNWRRSWSNPRAPRYLIDIQDNDPSDGGHAYIIGAYDRVTQEFEIRNSWGEWWANRGNARITYRAVEKELALPGWEAADVWSVVDFDTISVR